jgi:neutral ceramidase
MIKNIKWGIARLSIICMGQVGCFSHGAYAQTSGLYAGAAQVDITPEQSAYPHYRGSATGVHDRLYAKALVMRAGDRRIAIVVCDLLWIERQLSSKVRLLAAEKTGIPYSNILIAATHTHTSPAYHSNIRELTGSLRPPYDKDETIEEDGYARALVMNIAKSIEDANNSATTVFIGSATAVVDNLPVNRRFLMHDGKVQTNPGMGNPGILRSAGPIDPRLGIVLIRRASENIPFAALTNFSLHADTFGGTAFSADYPGFLAKSLSEKFGKNFVAIFAAAPCGDINHVDAIGKRRPSSEDIGTRLGRAVIGELNNLTRIDGTSLAALTEYVYAPCQEFSPEELAWAHQEQSEPIYNDSKFLERRRRLKIRSLERLRRTEAVPPTVEIDQWKLPLEVQAFKISDDLAIVGLPGEVFVELGLAIKAGSPFKTTLVIELTNSHIAYVPTRKAFAQGSYETINSRVAPGGGEMMVESAVRLLKELYSNK